jgi:glutaminyl-tRNA synthetase
LIKEVTDTLKFADGKVINDTYNKMIEELLGPKTKEDDDLIKKRSKLEADKESEDKKKTPSQK